MLNRKIVWNTNTEINVIAVIISAAVIIIPIVLLYILVGENFWQIFCVMGYCFIAIPLAGLYGLARSGAPATPNQLLSGIMSIMERKSSPPLTIDEAKKKLRRKFALFLILALTFEYLILSLPPFYYMFDSRLHLFIFLFLGCLLVFFIEIPMMRLFSSSRRKITGDYERAEKRFEESSNQLILNAFGYETFEHSYMGKFDKNLIHKEECEKNPELKFCLLVKLGLVYARDGQLKEAIQAFLDALSLKPADLIANFRIATLYESIGSGDKAIQHYEILKKYNNLAGNFDDYLDNQIKRIKTKGPRQRGPYDGSGLQWLS
ncbi:MAG TPA: hypothetical protein VMU29_10570 [Smithella sp.]|nr:hypothetical protein [Smithella sp.]